MVVVDDKNILVIELENDYLEEVLRDAEVTWEPERVEVLRDTEVGREPERREK